MSRRRSEGFTLIEVMMAVGLMTVGALAIMAMQQAATRGNIEARQIGTATEITGRWVERLRREALAWNGVGMTVAQLGMVTDQGAGTRASILSLLGTSATTDWIIPPEPSPAADPRVRDLGHAFDWSGLPVINAEDTRYCTYVRLTWVRHGALMRADVLTWWHRRGAGGDLAISNQSLFPNCGAGATAQVTADLASATPVLRSVRASTLLRWTQRVSSVDSSSIIPPAGGP